MRRSVDTDNRGGIDSRVPSIFCLPEKSVARIEKVEEWTRVELDHFTAPFYYNGDIVTLYHVGDLVDIEYCFETYRECQFILIYSIKHTLCSYRPSDSRNKVKCL